MNKAFVFLNTEVDAMNYVYENLKSVPGIVEAYRIYGSYDVALRIEAEDVNALKEIVTNKIRKAEGVRSTVTLLII